MAIVSGLKNIEALLDKPKGGSTGLKVRWVKLEDGQSVKIRFVNEVDQDSKFYDEDRGLAIVVSEHTNPKDYRRKALCTIDDAGRCFGCEMNSKDPKAGWRARLRFYTNVLVDDGIEDPYVAIWSMGVTKAATFNTIREYAMESDGITNMNWKLKRSGVGMETNYILIPGPVDADSFNWAGVEPYPLESAVREIPYSDQESFYLGYDNPTTSTSVDW